MAKGLNVVFGGAQFGNTEQRSFIATDEGALQVFEVLQKHNAVHIDTARLYGASEEALGRLQAGTSHGFTIDTKWYGGWTGKSCSSKEQIIADTKDSLAKLGLLKVHIFYMHSPDTNTPLEDTLAGINEAYKLGAFEHFGLSNCTPAQVREVYDVCKAKGYVLPSIYQGLYSPVNRKQEQLLFPLLRTLNIAFYAYSPIAGGFLTKTRSYVENGEGRFNKERFFGMYGKLYTSPSYLEALDEWGYIASEEGVTKAALAYRWVNYHSHLKAELGDGVIIGASSLKQLEQTLEALEAGPLSDTAIKGIDGIWEKVKPDALLDNFQAAFGSS
jgi:aflatoxin B1 aldehyde reductase